MPLWESTRNAFLTSYNFSNNQLPPFAMLQQPGSPSQIQCLHFYSTEENHLSPFQVQRWSTKINLHDKCRIFNYTEREKEPAKGHWSRICSPAIQTYPLLLASLLPKIGQLAFSQVPFKIIRWTLRSCILSLPLDHLMPNTFWTWTVLALEAFDLLFLMTDFITGQG